MAFLDIRETAPREYTSALKVPMLGRSAWPIETRLPSQCEDTVAERRYERPGNLVIQRTFSCALDGPPPVLGLVGIDGGFVEVLVRVEDLEANRSARVFSEAFTEVPLSGGATGIKDRFLLGVEHILGGLDHLFFVAGMILLLRSTRPIVETITAFTLAHSLTLGLTVLDLVRVPSPPVEVFIALSIVYLAYEIARRNDRDDGLSRPWRMAFAFGLLHGFGFAGALLQIDLPRRDLALTLLLFNLGIEAGQIAFASLFGITLWGLYRLLRTPRRQRLLEQAAAYSLGSIATFWVIERVAAF